MVSKMTNITIDAIFTRRSVRAYTGQQPDDAEVELLAKAALAAPSGGNKQPVTVIVVRNAALIHELEQAVIAGFEKKGETAIVERIKSRNNKIFYDAPVTYFLAVKDNALIDVGIAAQNIVIAASALGLGSIILGLPGIAFADPETSAYWKGRLGFPQGYEFGIAVAAGFSADSGKPHEIDPQKIKYAG